MEELASWESSSSPQAAVQAKIANFIESNPEGFESFLGERVIKISSSGQYLRIGIARAVCKKARVFVLKRATSALDIYTEGTVIKVTDAFS